MQIGPTNSAAPRRVFLEIGLAERCNLSCKFCFQSKSEKKLDTGELLDLLGKLRGSFITDIVFCGGEPLLNSNKMPGLLKAAKDNGLGTAIITNGLLLTPRLVSRLAPLLDMIQLPLDGNDRHTVAIMRGRRTIFDRTLSNIRLFNESAGFGGRIKIGVVVSALNHRAVEDIPELLIARGLRIDYLKFTQFTALGEAIPAAPLFDLPDERVLEIVAGIRRKREHPFLISYSLRSDRSVPKLVLKADGNIYFGWPERTPLCRCREFDPPRFAEEHAEEITSIIDYNSKVFADRT